ncbi:MAG: PD40 domain-containing protein [Chloroflexi bacterium]|nr:PD40 domain-containing protein [Chloroflexota bacterium]
MKGFYTLLTVVMLLCLVPAGAAQDGGRQVITPDSANQMIELIRLGRGSTEYVAYSPDGQTIAVASTIGVWLYPAAELNTETEPPLLKTIKLVEAMAFAPDGSTLVLPAFQQKSRCQPTTTFFKLQNSREQGA